MSRETFDLITNEKQGIQVSVETTSSLGEVVNLSKKGITAFSALDHTFSFVTLKDTGATTIAQYSRSSVVITSRAGKIPIAPDDYMDLIESFKPDIFHTLCDGDTQEDCGNKRMINAVNRTESFFGTCAAIYETKSSLAESMLIG